MTFVKVTKGRIDKIESITVSRAGVDIAGGVGSMSCFQPEQQCRQAHNHARNSPPSVRNGAADACFQQMCANVCGTSARR